MIWVYFIIKHFICDFPLQRPYMYLNKGTWGHPGGLLHAAIHGLGTWFILFFFIPDSSDLAAQLGVADFVIHYQTDYTKVKLCKLYNLKPDNSEWYWHLLGIDQLIHYLTYAWIIWVINN